MNNLVLLIERLDDYIRRFVACFESDEFYLVLIACLFVTPWWGMPDFSLKVAALA
jgi:hypothetical protein